MTKRNRIPGKTHIDTDEMTVVDKQKSAQAQKKYKTRLNLLLTVIQGSEIDFGKTYHFSQDSIRIGRTTQQTDIAVSDPKVSKIHCEISTVKTNELEQFVIRDLGSTNGSYVNGELVQQRILSPGDKISLGETVFRFSYNDEIEEEYHFRLFTFATTDALTGLYNRRYILNELENQWKIAKRNNRVFSIVIMDIDDFKQVNDTYGHSAGDELLKKLAFIMNHSLREQDMSGRVGGEEFLIILPETGTEGAFKLANRIRERIAETKLNYQGFTITTTISAGISQYQANLDTHTLYQLADQALYKAKHSGKNKIFEAVPPVPSPPPIR
jgi:two-component system cell cycle response regulator